MRGRRVIGNPDHRHDQGYVLCAASLYDAMHALTLSHNTLHLALENPAAHEQALREVIDITRLAIRGTEYEYLLYIPLEVLHSTPLQDEPITPPRRDARREWEHMRGGQRQGGRRMRAINLAMQEQFNEQDLHDDDDDDPNAPHNQLAIVVRNADTAGDDGPEYAPPGVSREPNMGGYASTSQHPSFSRSQYTESSRGTFGGQSYHDTSGYGHGYAPHRADIGGYSSYTGLEGFAYTPNVAAASNNPEFYTPQSAVYNPSHLGTSSPQFQPAHQVYDPRPGFNNVPMSHPIQHFQTGESASQAAAHSYFGQFHYSDHPTVDEFVSQVEQEPVRRRSVRDRHPTRCGAGSRHTHQDR